MLRWGTTPGRAPTPLAVDTADSSDHGSLPPPRYNENNYHFDHTTPNTTPYYHPSAITEKLHITEYQTTQTPLLHNNTHYVQLFTAFTLEEYRLLSLQQPTPVGQLDFTRPLRCIPRYDSALFSITLAEACNVHYCHTTSLHTTTSHNDSYIVVRLRVERKLLLRYLTSGQFVHFTRDYISYMISIQTTHYLPISQHSLLIYKVDYDMGRFTEIYNYMWNYHLPLLLPDLLHYLNNHEQLLDFQHKEITTIFCKSIHSMVHTTHNDRPHATPATATSQLPPQLQTTDSTTRDR